MPRPTSGCAHVELHRERVVVRRSVRGMRMALNMPVSAFAGVAHPMLPTARDGDAVAVVLEHKDPALALPLFVSDEADEAMAEWRAWGNVLGLPLLVAEDDGGLREPFARIGGVRIERAAPAPPPPQRAKRRRPSILLRRAAGRLTGDDAGASRRARDHRAELDR